MSLSGLVFPLDNSVVVEDLILVWCFFYQFYCEVLVSVFPDWLLFRSNQLILCMRLQHHILNASNIFLSVSLRTHVPQPLLQGYTSNMSK